MKHAALNESIFLNTVKKKNQEQSMQHHLAVQKSVVHLYLNYHMIIRSPPSPKNAADLGKQHNDKKILNTVRN